MLLVHYEHHAVDTPFRASHAIFIRPGKEPARPAPNEVPVMLQKRILSLRAFDEVGMLRNADLAEGEQIAPALERMFEDSRIAYIHLHFAKPGCYAARALRVAVE